MISEYSRKLARGLIKLNIFSGAEFSWEQNRQNFWLPLSKFQKLYVGIYLILKDYGEGIFPPRFEDQREAYENEKAFFSNLPGVDAALALESDMRKPFAFGSRLPYIQYFIKICQVFEACKVFPPQIVLEIGAGTGWVCEFLALMKFNVIATTIGEDSIAQISQRKASIERKGLSVDFDYHQIPMESLTDLLKNNEIPLVDAIFVFEALHHAYDYSQALKASFECLKPGGWLIICNEPNIIHTFVSYRVAKLSKTHEIGISGKKLIKHLKNIGFSNVLKFSNSIDLLIFPHWIAAQK